MATVSVLKQSPPPSPPRNGAESSSSSSSPHGTTRTDPSDIRACRSCRCTNLRIDWSQGDVICTNCGVVDEERLLDDRPEWREFSEDTDKVGSNVRSSLVPNNESLYFGGGLQPTTLSKHVYGGPTASSRNQRTARGKSTSCVRKRLLAVHNKIQRQMEKLHNRAVETATIHHKVRQRKRSYASMQGNGLYDEEDEDDWSSDHPRPEIEQMLLQEEEDAVRLQAARYADKWSLETAIRLFGTAVEIEALSMQRSLHDHHYDEDQDVKDSGLRKSARELYRAYSILCRAGRTLRLPDRVLHEATGFLCRYAARKDGLTVRGVSSTLKKKKQRTEGPQRSSSREEQEAKEALRDYNCMKQAGALCAGLLFYTSRHLGWPRSLAEVCLSIEPEAISCPNFDLGKEQFIKKKHCSRAMSEVKEVFPDLALWSSAVPVQETGSPTTMDSVAVNTANFTDHTIAQLQLPPVAEASVRALVHYVQRISPERDQPSNLDLSKLRTVCAAVTYFVCYTGEVMQRLASQATKSRAGSDPSAKQATAPFDALDDNDMLDDQKAYEMGQVWDAWSEQTSWKRSPAEVEQACGVSSAAFVDFYQSQLFPNRVQLLEALKQAVEKSKDDPTKKAPEFQMLQDTPLASVLLPQIVVASKLLS